MAQTSKVQGRAPRVFTDNAGTLCVLYHSTVVAKRAPDGTITLDSGGWRTVTTKTRINQFANEHCAGAFQVRQIDGRWEVQRRNAAGLVVRALAFVDGMSFVISA